MHFYSIYLKHLIVAISILSIAFFGSRIIQYVLDRYIKKKASDLNADPTHFIFLKHTLNFVVFNLAVFLIFYLIPELKTLGLTLFASAGIFAAILGFASQQAFSNIISGIFIVIFKPFRVGDFIKVGTGQSGLVEDITLRHTMIKSFENRRLVIPNSIIGSEAILNSSIADEKTCMWIELGISYDSSIDKAIQIIQEEAMKHPNFIDNRSEQDLLDNVPSVRVRVMGFGESSVNLRGYVWGPDPILGFSMKCDLYKSIKERFDRDGIEMPYPYRTIVYKKDQEAKNE